MGTWDNFNPVALLGRIVRGMEFWTRHRNHVYDGLMDTSMDEPATHVVWSFEMYLKDARPTISSSLQVIESIEVVSSNEVRFNIMPEAQGNAIVPRRLGVPPILPIVLDEPTSALDMSVQAQIVDLLRDLQQRHGLTYLFISHDLKVVRAVAHYLVVMKEGEVVEHGPAEQVFENPQTAYTEELMSAAFVR